MGAAFMEVVMGVERPRVALLSNGEEPTKGAENVVAAHAQLRAQPGELNFIGNVEGFAIGTGVADVIVADGFSGNVALKVMEGTSAALLGAVRGAAMSSTRSKARRAAAAAGAARRCATRSTRRSRAARCCSACAGSASCRTARSAPRVRARDRGRGPRRAAGRGGPDPRAPLRRRGR